MNSELPELTTSERCRFLAAQGLSCAEIARRLGISHARAYNAIFKNKTSKIGRPRKPRCATCGSKFCCHAHESSTDRDAQEP